MNLKKIKAVSFALVIVATMAAPVGMTGCGSLPEQPPRTVALDSLRATYDSALTAYEHFMRLHIAGKITPAKKAKVDAAWIKFSNAMNVAVQAAALNWSAASPQSVTKLKTDLFKVIESL